MSNEMNVQEIIAELDKISSLCDKIVDIDEKIDNVVSIENPKEMDEATQKSVKTLEDYQENQEKNLADVASKLPQNFPPAPPRKRLRSKTRISQSKIICSAISLFLIYISIVGIVLGILLDSNIFTLYWFALVGITIFMNIKFPVFEAIYYMKDYESLNDYDRLVKSWEKGFDEQYTTELNRSRYIAFRCYDDKFLSFVENCDKKFEEENIHHKEELEKIAERNQKKLDDFYKQRETLVNELTSITLIPEDLYCYAYRISSMLKQKRADSLKEAINLALDEKRKEEEEEARREEAARREAILEQQAYDNRMHNEAMQRAAEEEARATREYNAAMERAVREHNAAMERAAQAQATAAEAQAREAQKQTKMVSQQANDARRAALERCSKCKNRGSCSVHGDAAIGCPSFRPR